MRIWRICRSPYAAFSGEGAGRFGGRWNSRGVRMVYASTSLALAAIELFVHLEPGQAPADLVCLSATLPEGEPARTIESEELPPGWWADAPTAGTSTTRNLGDAWIRSLSSLALKVPSVPIRHEWNVLLNPLHPRMAELWIEPLQPFVFDARMFQQKETAENLEEVAVPFADVAGPEPKQIRLPKLLVQLGLATSGAEANRKIAEKAVKLDAETAENLLVPLAALPARIVVRLGKRAKVAVVE